MTNESQISSFYACKKIFITGGTGFMGKVLIWKLLQSCPNVDVIYVLMRAKYGQSPACRKEEFFKSPIFSNFKRDDPEVLKKVEFVYGDVGEEELGLSQEDRVKLINGVSIIFHVAAVLKMDTDLLTAVNVNTIGTIRTLDLAKNMKKLEAFVHVSTAFCCCENLMVEEKIYLSKHNPKDVINITQWMEPELLEMITPKLIYPLPNTYIYSKRLTETVLLDYVGKVPIIVARPSIVIPSFKEPLPGWNDTLNGPVGVFIAGGRGVLRTSMMNIDLKTDIIPVDFAINGILTLPWVNSKEKLMKEISVYNISQSAHEVTWRETLHLFKIGFEKYPPNRILWYPQIDFFTNSILVYTIKSIFVQYLPAYGVDFLLLLIGQKPFLVKVQNKLRHGEKVLRYFTQRQWTFVNDNLLKVDQLLNEVDKKVFPINMNEVKDLQAYVDNAIIGAKVFVFKEDMNSLESAKRMCKIMYVIDKIALILRYYLLWKIFSFIFNIILNAFKI